MYIIAQFCNCVKRPSAPSAFVPQCGPMHINKTQHFEGVEREVRELYIGGYEVLDKRLKDRKGSTLSCDDVTHFGKTVVALKETIRLMGEIDEVIPSWPIE